MTPQPLRSARNDPRGGEFVEAREQLKERRRLLVGVIVVIALVCGGIISVMYLSATGTSTQQADNRTLEQIMN